MKFVRVMLLVVCAMAIVPTLHAREETSFSSELMWGFSNNVFVPISPLGTGNEMVTFRTTDATRLLVKVDPVNGDNDPFLEQAVGVVTVHNGPDRPVRFRAYAVPTQQLGPVDVIASIPGRPDITITVNIVAPPLDFYQAGGETILSRWSTEYRANVCGAESNPLFTGARLEEPGSVTIRYSADPPGSGVFLLGSDLVVSSFTQELSGSGGFCAIPPMPPQTSDPNVRLVGVEPGPVTLRAEIVELPMAAPITRSFTVTEGSLNAQSFALFGQPYTLVQGMQCRVRVALPGRHHGGRTLTIRPTTPGSVLLAQESNEFGSDSLSVFVPDGAAWIDLYGNVLESSPGSIRFELSMNGLQSTNSLEFSVLSPVTTVRRPTVAIRESEGPFVATVDFEGLRLRPGGPGRSVAFSTSDPAHAVIIGPDGLEYSSIEVTITRDTPRNSMGAFEAVSFVARSTGRVCITGHMVGTPPQTGDSCDVRVLMSDDVIVPRESYRVGAGLSVEDQLIVLGRATDHTIPLRVRSTDPGVLLVAPSSWLTPLPEYQITSNEFMLAITGAPGETGFAEVEISGQGVPTTYITVEVVTPSIRTTLPQDGPRLSDPPVAQSSGWIDLGIPSADGQELEEVQPLARTFTLPVSLQLASNGAAGFGSVVGFNGCSGQAGATSIICSFPNSSGDRRRAFISLSGCSSSTATVSATAPGFIALPISTAQTRLSMRGDVSADGFVSFLDITSVLSNYGRTYPGTTYPLEPNQGYPGDADGNLTVNFQDLMTVLNMFNRTCL